MMTINKGGQTYQVPANRAFYIKFLKQSQFFGRITILADKVNQLISEKGNSVKFNRQKFLEAAGLCIYAHRHQRRRISGEPYADHPITLAELEVNILKVTDQAELIALLLHDVVEDTVFDLGFVHRRFGRPVARLVDGMTKIEKMERDRLINETNIVKFVTALTQDIRVLRMKMTDRGSNLMDAAQQEPESRERNCREALDFYVPLGVLAGFFKAARHLSDVAFRGVNPERHAEIADTITTIMAENDGRLEQLGSEIKRGYRRKLGQMIPKKYFDPANMRRFLDAKRIEILTKPRTVYEVDQIATMRGAEARHLSDIVMMQVTVEAEADCYTLAEVIHSLGVPIDRYWHDYIKDPKINGYQSLHTAILVDGRLVRFQIRTHEMQRLSQDGVLHNAYSANGQFRQPKIPWLTHNWLKILLEAGDRRDKILLTKSLSHARLATVMVEGGSMGQPYYLHDVLLPRGISPLEMAFIADPMVGLFLKAAYHHDVEKPLHEPIEEGIGLIRLRIADQQQYIDYTKLLNNPLARLRFIEALNQGGEQARYDFVCQTFQNHLPQIHLMVTDIERQNSGIMSELVESMLERGIPVQDMVNGMGGLVKFTQDPILAIERLAFEPDQSLPDHIIEDMRRVFPVERFGFKGQRLELAIPVRSELQARQLANYLAHLRRQQVVKVTRLAPIRLPIIDDLTINPDSLFYSHDIAKQAAQALQQQQGSVMDLNLNPPALDLMRPDQLQSSGINEVVGEHLETASLLLLTGHERDVSQMQDQLREVVDNALLPSPLILMFAKEGFYQSEGVVRSLRELADIPTLSISEMGHRSNFILEVLKRRLGVRSTR